MRYSDPCMRPTTPARRALLLGLLVVAPPPAAAQAPTLEQIVAQANKTEGTIIQNLRNFRPVVEVYVQNLAEDARLGLVPTADSYLLGRFDWRDGPRLQPVSGGRETPRFTGAARNKSLEYVPDGFAAMASPDWELLAPEKYTFQFVRREFLGETRCYVVDVRPKKELKDGFAGRIWVEDRGYNIVRFNGINRRVERDFFRKKVAFHVDSWRVNVLPGLWLPSYIYVEETNIDLEEREEDRPRFKSQIRMWGFDLERIRASQAYTAIRVHEPTAIDQAEPERQLSPVQSQRRWELEAERNVIERLERAQLIAMPGDVENVLETVLNNLLVTSEIALDRPVRARVLLTSPLESFTMGHTIVLSRGLIDVLPDEASLATMLAHELAHIVLGHPLIDTQFAFADRMMIDDNELLKTLKVRRTADQEAAADTQVLAMLRRSPYNEDLAKVGLFLRVVAERARTLPNLIHPHIGDHIVEGGIRLGDLMKDSPELALDQVGQVSALPLGSRLVLDPWNGKLQLLRSATSDQASTIREQVPLVVMPLTPNLKYAEMPAEPEAVAATPPARPAAPPAQ